MFLNNSLLLDYSLELWSRLLLFGVVTNNKEFEEVGVSSCYYLFTIKFVVFIVMFKIIIWNGPSMEVTEKQFPKISVS